MIGIYFTSSNENAIIAAEAKISANCQFPNEYGTLRWSIVQKAINEDLWFFSKPHSDYTSYQYNFTIDEMLDGVDMTDITEQEKNQDWFPPDPPA